MVVVNIGLVGAGMLLLRLILALKATAARAARGECRRGIRRLVHFRMLPRAQELSLPAPGRFEFQPDALLSGSLTRFIIAEQRPDIRQCVLQTPLSAQSLTTCTHWRKLRSPGLEPGT
jgi:hypothetical protein